MIRILLGLILTLLPLSADWSPPSTLSSRGWANTPRIVLSSSGDAHVIYTFSSDNITFGTEVVQLDQLVSSSPYLFSLPANHSTFLPNLSLSPLGDLVAVWIEHFSESEVDQAVASYYRNGSWSFPENISQETIFSFNTDTAPSLFTDAQGITTVVWSDYLAPNSSIRSNQLIGGEWQGRKLIGFFDPYMCSPVMAGCPSGKHVILWSDGFQGHLYYAHKNDDFLKIAQIPGTKTSSKKEKILPAVASNNVDQMVMSWVNHKGVVEAAFLIDGHLDQVQPLSSSQSKAKELDIGLNDHGEAAAVWISQTGNLYSVQIAQGDHFRFKEPITLYGPTPHPLSHPQVVINAHHHTAIIWQEEVSDEESLIYTSLFYEDIFHSPKLLSHSRVKAKDPRLAINDKDELAAVWVEGDPGKEAVLAIRGKNVFTSIPEMPAPPFEFTGKQTINRFLTGIEYINTLYWTASTDTTTVSYRLYRDNTLIATIPASGPYTYEDRRHQKCTGTLYSLTAVNAQGRESQPATLKL